MRKLFALLIGIVFTMAVIFTAFNYSLAASENQQDNQQEHIQLKLHSVFSLNGNNGNKWQVVDMNDETKELFICPYHGDEEFFDKSKWGWFFGEECKWLNKKRLTEVLQKQKERKKAALQEKKEKGKKEILWDKTTKDEYLNTLTAEQFRKLFNEVKDKAVMEPTEKHIAGYMHMTDFMRRKSLMFAYATGDFVLDNPKYDMQKDIGTTSWSYRTMLVQHNKKRMTYLQQAKDKVGLYFFLQGDCSHCEEQAKVLKWFMADCEISVLTVSKDFCPPNLGMECVVKPAIFKKFQVQYTPSIVMVYKKGNKPYFQVVANGLITEELLGKRIYFYLKKIDSLEEENETQYKLVHKEVRE
jgi:hypothetical protein